MISLDLLPRFSTAEIHSILSKLDEIGHKWTGTPGEALARDFIIEKMAGYGLSPRVEEFDYLRYSDAIAGVTITAPVQRKIQCKPISYCDNKEVEGEALYVGLGTEDDFRLLQDVNVDFQDKVLVAHSWAPHQSNTLVEKSGASGFVGISDTPEPNLITQCCGAFYGSTAGTEMLDNPFDFKRNIPGAMIPFLPGGHQLLSLMTQGKVMLRTSHQATYSMDKSWNIVGEIKGTEVPEEKVIIGAHYDTPFGAPGIWDNGTGVAALLETARAIKAANIPLKRTLVFIAFGAEEAGLWGSVSYTQKYKEDLQRNCIAYFNHDGACGLPVLTNTTMATENLKDFMVETGEEVSWRTDKVDNININSGDYEPFRDMNIPCSWIGGVPLHPYYHTEKDVLEHGVSLKDVAAATQMIALCALKTATSNIRF